MKTNETAYNLENDIEVFQHRWSATDESSLDLRQYCQHTPEELARMLTTGHIDLIETAMVA